MSVRIPLVVNWRNSTSVQCYPVPHHFYPKIFKFTLFPSRIPRSSFIKCIAFEIHTLSPYKCVVILSTSEYNNILNFIPNKNTKDCIYLIIPWISRILSVSIFLFSTLSMNKSQKRISNEMWFTSIDNSDLFLTVHRVTQKSNTFLVKVV